MAGFAESVARLKAIAEPTRLRMLCLLKHSEYSVKDLTEVLGQSQPRVSRHVKLLGDAGFVERNQEGSFVFVRSSPDHAIQGLVTSALGMVGYNDAQLLRDRERAAHLRQRQAAEAQSYFDKNAAHWDEIRSLHVPEKEVEAAMADMLGQGPFETMLDLGTGTGRMLEVFASRCQRLVGIDTNRAMIKYARVRMETAQIGNCSVRLGDLYDLPFAEGTVDAVMFHQVLHFLENPKAAVLEAVRVLKHGGRLMIADFAPHELESLRARHAHVRLGFGATEVASWFGGTKMRHGGYRELSGLNQQDNSLTVALWLATKAADLPHQLTKIKQDTA